MATIKLLKEHQVALPVDDSQYRSDDNMREFFEPQKVTLYPKIYDEVIITPLFAIIPWKYRKQCGTIKVPITDVKILVK